MLEFVIVFLLARKNGQIAQAKGLNPTGYQWGTVGLWFTGEILGMVLGLLLLGGRSGLLFVYLFAIFGAVGGAIAAYYWASQAAGDPYAMREASLAVWRPTHLAPPTGMPGYAAPDGSQTPTAAIPPGAELALMERQADWARVRGPNGWTGWVDGRQLQAK